MPNNYKGLNISGLKSTTKLSRVQVEPTIDFVELTDRGSVSENPSKLRTAGAGHRKSPNVNARAKSTVGETIDMGGLWEPASEYDYGIVSADTFVISENSRWSARRKLMNPPAGPAVVTVDWSNATLAYTLDNPNPFGTSDRDLFGISVAISGDYAIVGARGEDDSGGTTSGKAYIYNVTTGVEVHTLNNPNPYGTSTDDYFGHSVAISGDYAIVGAHGEDDATGVNYSGKAYIYNVSTGALVHTLNNPNPFGTSNFDIFSYSVAISSDYAIVGAYAEDDSGGTSSGKAYIYNVATGALVHTLDNPNAYGTSASDDFGRTVAISDNYAIVGAWSEDDAGGETSGKAYIYNATTGALVHTLNNPNPDGILVPNGDSFGLSVAISGDYAIVGAMREGDGSGGVDSGKAYIFNVITGTLVHTLDNPNAYGTSDGDFFGSAVAIEGNYAIVGVSAEDDSGGNNSGKVYIFDVTTGLLVHTLDNPNAYGTSASDSIGGSVAISGGRIIVGAHAEDEDGNSSSGKSYIFKAV